MLAIRRHLHLVYFSTISLLSLVSLYFSIATSGGSHKEKHYLPLQLLLGLDVPYAWWQLSNYVLGTHSKMIDTLAQLISLYKAFWKSQSVIRSLNLEDMSSRAWSRKYSPEDQEEEESSSSIITAQLCSHDSIGWRHFEISASRPSKSELLACPADQCFVCVCTYMRVCVWRPELHIRCFPWSLSFFIYWGRISCWIQSSPVPAGLGN